MSRVLLIAATLVLAACASTPQSRFYTLGGAPAPPLPSSTLSIVVGPVTIPAVVDRPEIVVTVSENEVWLDEFNRWAGPLGEAIAVATAEDLGAALGTPRATAAVQGAADADYRVSVEVQRFESAPGSYALLDAVFTVRRTSDGRAATGRTTAREAPSDKSYAELAAAHSRAVARLAGDIAATTRTLAAQAPRPATPNR
ncbi:MAG: PqiC family protein [Burkholderiales bacterium]